MWINMLGFITGFISFFSAFGFLAKHKLLRWYGLPLLLWIYLVAASSITLASLISPYIINILKLWFKLDVHATEDGFWSLMKYWVHAGLQIGTVWLVNLLLWYCLGRMMKYIILIIMSPLLAWLSEKAEAILTGKEYEFSWVQLIKDAWRGVKITLRNLSIELILMFLGFWLAIAMPALSPFITLLLFAINCYFMGFSMFDYNIERRKMNVNQSVRFMRGNKMLVLGLGFAFNLLSCIPFADWVIAPINGSVGATLSLQKVGK
jgi:CysZ protein